MKAYVIKNKEGKYYVTIFGKPIFSKEIADAYINKDKQNLDCIIIDNSFKDCEVVEITIAEGDFEEENRLLKKALELACEEVAEYECDNYNQNGYGTIRTNHFEYFIQQAKESKKYE